MNAETNCVKNMWKGPLSALLDPCSDDIVLFFVAFGLSHLLLNRFFSLVYLLHKDDGHHKQQPFGTSTS